MITRTEAGEPIEAAGHVALSGADATTPMHKVAARIGRETTPAGLLVLLGDWENETR